MGYALSIVYNRLGSRNPRCFDFKCGCFHGQPPAARAGAAKSRGLNFSRDIISIAQVWYLFDIIDVFSWISGSPQLFGISKVEL